jgi:hypothetical protein
MGAKFTIYRNPGKRKGAANVKVVKIHPCNARKKGWRDCGVPKRTDIPLWDAQVRCAKSFQAIGKQALCATTEKAPFRVRMQGGEIMLGLIALVLIVCWLLGLFAFHVSTGLFHVLLVIGLVLLILHFVRGRSASI